MLFPVAVLAKRYGPFVVRFLCHAAMLVVRARLHSNVGCLRGFIVTAQAWHLSYLCQIDRIGVAYDFQLDPLRYAEGAFE
jgi:hypothetical protein